jgi:hypothetical protein
MRSAEVINHLKEYFKEHNMMSSPQAGLSDVKTSTGRKIEFFTFGISRYCDGVVNVFHEGFIKINWEVGRVQKREIFESMDEVKEWVDYKGWSE